MIIGLYTATDSFKRMPLERINALTAEAMFQGVTLIIIDDEGIDFNNRTVTGLVRENNSWVTKTMPFPQSLITDNPRIVSKRSETEKRIRELIPITTYLIHSKQYISENVLAKTNLSKYLIETKKIEDIQDIIQFIDEHQNIFIKPINGFRGMGIYNIFKQDGQYILKNNTINKSLTATQLMDELATPIKEKPYIMQPTIFARTKEALVFDFRIHVQRNGEGNWVVTKAYPRIGKKGSMLSNVSQGGYTSTLEYFLFTQWEEEQAKYYLDALPQIGLDIAEAIAKHYKFSIDELGIDLTIDRDGSIKFYEANAGPQSKYHEQERAKNTIAYAKYITKKKNNPNGIIIPEKNSKNSKKMIAMLTNTNQVNSFSLSCASISSMLNADFCFFDYRHLNIEEKTVMATLFENGNWITKKISYLNEIDVIFDRLRLRGKKNYKSVYDELNHLPFNNELYGDSISKKKLYDYLITTNFGKEYLIDYAVAEHISKVKDFLDKYQVIILKPAFGSFGRNIHVISSMENGDYTQIINGEKNLIPKDEVDHLLNDICSKERMIVQQFIFSRTLEDQPFDIRVHLIRGKNREWKFANVYPRVGINAIRINPTSEGGYIGAVEGFLARNYSKEQSKSLTSSLKEISLAAVKELEILYKEELFEVGIDFVIDKQGKIYFVEANLNKPGVIYYDFEVARHGIEYCLELVKE